MLKVITQAIWSWDADRLPCICGNRTLTIMIVMAYSVVASTTAIRIIAR